MRSVGDQDSIREYIIHICDLQINLTITQPVGEKDLDIPPSCLPTFSTYVPGQLKPRKSSRTTSRLCQMGSFASDTKRPRQRAIQEHAPPLLALTALAVVALDHSHHHLDPLRRNMTFLKVI